MNTRMLFIFLTVLAAASALSFAKSGKLAPSQLRRVRKYLRRNSAVNGSRRRNNLAANQWKSRRGNKNYFWNKLKFDFALLCIFFDFLNVLYFSLIVNLLLTSLPGRFRFKPYKNVFAMRLQKIQ